MMNEHINYYLVIAKCGHVGKGKYTNIVFPVYAESAHDAAQMVLSRPKVKKQLSNAITQVIEVNYEIYIGALKEFRNNDYIKAHNKRDILNCEIDVDNLEIKEKNYKKSFSSRIERINFIFKKNKIWEEQLSC